MVDRIFLDSNVLLYALDASAPSKRARAQQWLERIGAAGTGALSWQVLHEFYWNATRKFALGTVAARELVTEFILWQPLDTSAALVHRAWHWSDAAQLAYWDALILAAAERAGARYLLSEDFQPGRVFGDVQVLDPFSDAGAAVLATLA